MTARSAQLNSCNGRGTSPIASAHALLISAAWDRHIAEIETKGRLARQKSTGYNQRSRVETQMGRWKAVR
jgi:hypothetical protein